MTRRQAILAGCATALAAVVAAIVAHTYSPTITGGGKRGRWSETGWTQTTATRCCIDDVRITARAARRLGLEPGTDAGAGEWLYAVMRLCRDPVADAGTWQEIFPEVAADELERLANGVRTQCPDEPTDGAVTELDIVLPPIAYTAGFACSCRPAGTDAGCEALAGDGGWVPCAAAWTYDPGRSRGVGRVPTPCVEALGARGMNPLCLEVQP